MVDDTILRLKNMAKRIRRTAVDMAHDARRHGAHLGGSLSSVEIFTVLYGQVLKLDPANPLWEERDRMIVGKEHGRLSEYPAMVEAGLLQKEDLATHLVDGGLLAGHPRIPEKGLEYSSCSLGMALPVAVGMAIAAKRKGQRHKIYSIIGDGEMDEGSVWEAILSAAHYKLDNLVLVVDKNGLSSDGFTEDIMALGNLRDKFLAFGWDCTEVEDGHDIEMLLKAFDYTAPGKPYAVIAKTVKGKGISFAENVAVWHKGIMTDELYQKAIKELGEEE